MHVQQGGLKPPLLFVHFAFFAANSPVSQSHT